MSNAMPGLARHSLERTVRRREDPGGWLRERS